MESLIFKQKKYQGIVIKTMAAIAAGVGMMVMCCSSSVAALMMGGSDETPATGAGAGAAAGPTAGPAPEYIVYDEDMTYPESGHVELGEAASIEACRDLAKSKFYNTFGFRDSTTSMPNTCFAYRWSPDLTGLGGAAGHSVGCVKPGEDIQNGGCTFVENVYPESDMPYPASGHTELGEGTSFGACRTLATAAGKTSVGFRSHQNNCWTYNNVSELNDVQPNKVVPHHFVGCTTATADIAKGCT